MECRGFESHPRQLIFLRQSDCLGCAVLLCLVVYKTLLASFFHLSLNHVLYIPSPPLPSPPLPSPPLSLRMDDILTEFITRTRADAALAHDLLEAAEWNLDNAVGMYCGFMSTSPVQPENQISESPTCTCIYTCTMYIHIHVHIQDLLGGGGDFFGITKIGHLLYMYMLASFFLPSHLSLKHVYMYTCISAGVYEPAANSGKERPTIRIIYTV